MLIDDVGFHHLIPLQQEAEMAYEPCIWAIKLSRETDRFPNCLIHINSKGFLLKYIVVRFGFDCKIAFTV